ncbi:MAG: hypothetical protein IT461_02550 [Planctomycetes bacterium]|jgi:hypothetical protein|nr:hypothetical protein [Planctomycetota bacterium]
MKGAQIAVWVWMLNAVVFFGGAALGYQVYTTYDEDLKDTFDKTANARFKANRKNWEQKTGDVDISAFGYRELSPRKRPPPPKPPDKPDTTPKPPDPEPTDEQLKAELEREINAKFSLIRIFHSSNPEMSSAMCTAADAGNASIVLTVGMNFPKRFGNVFDAKLKALAAKDYNIKGIDPDKVLVEAPSSKRPAKRFTVELKFNAAIAGKIKAPDIKDFGKPSGMGGASGGPLPAPPPDTSKPVEATVDTRPKESTYNENDGSWLIGTDDYMNVNTDDFVQYAKTVVDEKGEPIGIQISDDIPEDNVVVKRGGKKGDIIKSINGVKVTNMADVRRTVREQYNSGTTEFEVLFEREGVPQRKLFKVPQKKK